MSDRCCAAAFTYHSHPVGTVSQCNLNSNWHICVLLLGLLLSCNGGHAAGCLFQGNLPAALLGRFSGQNQRMAINTEKYQPMAIIMALLTINNAVLQLLSRISVTVVNVNSSTIILS